MKLTTKSQITVEEPAYYYDATGTKGDQGHPTADTHTRIHSALESITDTLEQDRYILAAILTSTSLKITSGRRQPFR